MNTGHLSPDQLTRYQNRTLGKAELFAADRHVAECAECRDILFRQSGSAAKLSALRSSFSEHLGYHHLAACAEGRGDAGGMYHLKQCPQCHAAVEDLREFRQELGLAPSGVVAMPRRRAWAIPAWSAAAAALILTAGLAWWNGPGQRPAPPVPTAHQQPPTTEPDLAPEQQQAVQLALTERKFDRAPVLDRLISKRGVLLGEPGEPKTFDLGAPLGTAVMNDRPTFRWQVVRGATQYVVSVFDDSFHKVAESPALSTNEWQPAKSLPRARVYLWQVSATIGGEVIRAPIPPAPEARFQVAGPDAVEAIEKARQEHPGNHLLLAVLLAKNGALDESALELDALAATDPATAQGLRESLAEIRKR